MKLRSVSIIKEARPLLGLWTVVTLAVVAALVRPGPAAMYWVSRQEAMLFVAICFGIPLLATLVFGVEFQHRTLLLLLAQPRQRKTIWRQKLLIIVAAVLPLAIVGCWAARSVPVVFGTQAWLLAAAWIVLTTAAAPLWTLIARSSIGGVTLNCGLIHYPLFAGWVYVAEMFQGSAWRSAFLMATVVIALGYATAMAWLGRRVFLRFQAVEGMQAGEAVLPGAHLFPHAIADWFRCRPRSPVLNLIRREFRLLRTLWALGLLCAIVWVVTIGLGLLPTAISAPVIGTTISVGFVIALLAGMLSLSEEKTWGTHAWQMTLPIPTSIQWLVKLSVALFTSVICAVVVPVTALHMTGWFPDPRHYASNPSIWIWALDAMLVTFAAFWSACMVKGAVRATVRVFGTLILIVLAIQSVSWGLDLVDRHGLFDALSATLDPMRVARAYGWLFSSPILQWVILAAILVPILGTALIQSYRRFAARNEDTRHYAWRTLVPLVVVAAACSLALGSVEKLGFQAYQDRSQLLRETHFTIERLRSQAGSEGKLLRITDDELANVPHLSDRTRQWLHDASITLDALPELSHARSAPAVPDQFWMFVTGSNGRAAAPYSAVLHLANGAECALSFRPASASPVGSLAGFCRAANASSGGKIGQNSVP